MRKGGGSQLCCVSPGRKQKLLHCSRGTLEVREAGYRPKVHLCETWPGPKTLWRQKALRSLSRHHWDAFQEALKVTVLQVLFLWWRLKCSALIDSLFCWCTALLSYYLSVKEQWQCGDVFIFSFLCLCNLGFCTIGATFFFVQLWWLLLLLLESQSETKATTQASSDMSVIWLRAKTVKMFWDRREIRHANLKNDWASAFYVFPFLLFILNNLSET